jgi:hypothetical protein
VSTALAHGLMGGVPILVFVILWLLTLTKKPNHPKPYAMSEKWTYGPILWAATDENVGAGHGHGHASAGHSVGGSASGRW